MEAALSYCVWVTIQAQDDSALPLKHAGAAAAINIHVQ